MIREHDDFSIIGERHLGEGNIRWAERMDSFPYTVSGSGPMTLLKSILNDYWADVPDKHTMVWDSEKIEVVMSKLYWCWVAWLEATHVECSE